MNIKELLRETAKSFQADIKGIDFDKNETSINNRHLWLITMAFIEPNAGFEEKVCALQDPTTLASCHPVSMFLMRWLGDQNIKVDRAINHRGISLALQALPRLNIIHFRYARAASHTEGHSFCLVHNKKSKTVTSLESWALHRFDKFRNQIPPFYLHESVLDHYPQQSIPLGDAMAAVTQLLSSDRSKRAGAYRTLSRAGDLSAFSDMPHTPQSEMRLTVRVRPLRTEEILKKVIEFRLKQALNWILSTYPKVDQTILNQARIDREMGRQKPKMQRLLADLKNIPKSIPDSQGE